MKLLFIAAISLLLMGSSDDLDILEDYGDEIVDIRSEKMYGSGFAVKIGNKSVLVSAAHVCESAFKEKDYQYVTGLYKNKRYKLKIIKIFKSTDLCFLNRPKGIVPFKLEKKPVRHETLYALGYTLQPISNDIFVTKGRFKHVADDETKSTKEEEIKECLSLGPNMRLEGTTINTIFGPVTTKKCIRTIKAYVTSIPGSGGMSGGPTLTGDGKVVGVNMATIGRLNLLVIVPAFEIERYYKNKDKLK